MKEPHVVPLSKQALEVLERLRSLTGHFELVFAGDHDAHKPMSENTVNNALRRMGYNTKTEVCGHGFRSIACSALIGVWPVEPRRDRTTDEPQGTQQCSRGLHP